MAKEERGRRDVARERELGVLVMLWVRIVKAKLLLCGKEQWKWLGEEEWKESV